MKNVTHTEDATASQMSVMPWKRGWLEFLNLDGWMRWWSSLTIFAMTVRISGGMIAVTYNHSNTSKESQGLLLPFPTLNSGYRHASDSLLSVTWQAIPAQEILSSKSVIHSFASLDDIAVAASPTLQVLRHECRLRSGEIV